MAINNLGVWTYTDTDSVKSWAEFLNLSTNSVTNAMREQQMNTVHVCHSQQDMTDRKDKLVTRGVTGTTSRPLIFHRSDQGITYRWDGSTFRADGDNAGLVVIDGRSYPQAVSVKPSVATWAVSSHPVYLGTINVTTPFNPPTGWHWNFTVWGGGVFAVTSPHQELVSGTTWKVRVLQFANAGTGGITSILCELVKTSS